MITIGNKRHGATGEYVGRQMPGILGSILGNPYAISRERTRQSAIVSYTYWLDRQLAKDTPAATEFKRLVELARQGDLTLVCWCAPEHDCHARVIKERIEREIGGGE